MKNSKLSQQGCFRCKPGFRVLKWGPLQSSVRPSLPFDVPVEVEFLFTVSLWVRKDKVELRREAGKVEARQKLERGG